ncbi:MAG: right-handed parallel beta-helix repeat-containing protein [Planctomycetota bacterium]|jgi:hypothetical protein
MTTVRNAQIQYAINFVLITLALCPFTYGKVIYVDDDAAGTNDGSSWEKAYVYLQDALTDANSAEKPVEIQVAQGVYTPDMGVNQIPSDREATFHLINGVSLKGGYAGLNEPDPNTRDIELYETILSGDLNGNDVEVADPSNLPNELTRRDNSCHVTTGSGTDMTAVLDGFTITGGNADGSDQLYEGGGMYNSSGNPTLTDCTLRDNSALRGGGMSNWENSNPTLANCKFYRNWANYGAAIQNNFTSSPMLTNCSFIENSAETGGGMYNGSSSNPELVDCTFSRNFAEIGGGMRNSSFSSPTLTNCTFNDNSTHLWGGGMMNWDCNAITLTDCTFSRNSGRGLYNKNSSLVLKNCIFSENPAGGMFNENSNLTLTNCVFSENSTPGNGGGMSNLDSILILTNCTFIANSAGNGGGISSASEGYDETKLKLTNCTFTSNLAVGKIGKGGGMYCSTWSRGKTELTMTNCMFTGNQALGEHGCGGGIYSSIDSPILTNCIFSANSAGGSGGAIYNDEGWPEVSNCRFTGNSAGGEGGGMYNTGGIFSVASPTLTNCTLSGNVSSYGGAIYNQYGTSSNLINCILWGNIADHGSQVCLAGTTSSIAVEYSNLQGGRTAIPLVYDSIVWGPSNINVDPDFVQAGYWTEPTPRQPGEPTWIEGDYHLKSQAGRWDPNIKTWVQDDTTSPCIDAGDPDSPIAFEPSPNGGTINMGAYGGTAEASKSIYVLNTKYSGGIGRHNDPYQISTADDLILLGETPEDYNKHIILTADIDLDPNLPGRKVFDRAVIAPDMNDVELGIQGAFFTGTFNGNDHTISHLTIKGDSFLGLFGSLYGDGIAGAIISNLRLEAVDVNGTGDYVGGLVGYFSGSISTTYSTGTVIGEECVGGLVGYDSAIIDNGRMYYSTIESCYSSANVSGVDCVGGLVGTNLSGIITNCYATGSVVACPMYWWLPGGVGSGLVGGGLVGENWNTISYCYATGSVVASGNNFVPGISGGLVGENHGNIMNSFWDTQTSGQAVSYGGTPKTTAEMQTASTFLEAGWVFADELANGNAEIWWILEGQDYPRLWWERPYEPPPEPKIDETTILGTWS